VWQIYKLQKNVASSAQQLQKKNMRTQHEELYSTDSIGARTEQHACQLHNG
jgi:hypothetical protein